MAAYAASVSLMQTMEQIQHQAEVDPISFYREQFEFLNESARFLREFLKEGSVVSEGLESRIEDAAYAALACLMHTMEQIQHQADIDPNSFDREQFEFLSEIASLLQDFLEEDSEGAEGLESRIADASLFVLMHTMEQIQHESHMNLILLREQFEFLHERVNFFLRFFEEGSNGDYDLDRRIADAAYAAEDAIESYFVDLILAGSNIHNETKFINLCQALEQVIEGMDMIRNDVMDIKEKNGINDLQQRGSSVPAASSRTVPVGKNKMVGFDDELIQIMEKLIGQQSSQMIFPISGMGGIGKTTLARNIYDHSIIVQHFDTRMWVTISQEYNVREILVGFLFILNKTGNENLAEFSNRMSRTSNECLGEQLHKGLWGRRYLIVLDDMWNIEVWDNVKLFFTDNNNGSRIIVTTRSSTVANQLSYSPFEMKFIDDDNGWNLFCEEVFAQENCPTELEQIGKEIVKKCKGLPLSIIVVGGLLAKSNRTVEYWEHVAEDLRSIDDDEHCLKVLSLSYNQLPVHLKPCFLYMAVFPEDHDIRISKLTHLWIAEGFLKPIRSKSLEEIAEEFLKELIERNLILVREWGSRGNVKSCYIHDLMRDLCLREAQKEKFLSVMWADNPDVSQDMNIQRRFVINQSTLVKIFSPQVLHALQSASLARSFIFNSDPVLPSPTFKLLRVLNVMDKRKEYEDKYNTEAILQLVNLRYLAFSVRDFDTAFHSLFFRLRNVQTLIVRGIRVVAPPEIWDMPQLRHIKFDLLVLPNPPSYTTDEQDYVVLENLQTLMTIEDFQCSKEVLKKIPNIRKLVISYGGNINEWVPMMYKALCGGPFGLEGWPHYRLDNLARLQNLESLALIFHFEPNRKMLLNNLSFPCSLKKLTLQSCNLQWEDMTIIGSLPHLEVLKLHASSSGREWNPIEGEFPCLKFLQIEWCICFVNWNACSTHYPRLEHLVLRGLTSLKEIPLDFGEIPTLRIIECDYCSESAVISAKDILQEQEELGNFSLRVLIRSTTDSESSEAICNIQ